MNLTEGTKGWFTPSNGGQRVRAEVTKVWGPQCVNLRCEDGSQPSSVLIKQDGCSGHYFEPDQVDAVEAEIKAKGLDVAPRVTKDHIEALMARVAYLGGRVEQTTSTVVHAFLDGNFLLASGHSACVSPENFNAELGFRMAKGQAEQKARDQLWLLEGYSLRSRLAGPTEEQVNRFLTWPVPASVHPDGVPGKPGRTGTNLLSALEARDMLRHVLNG